MVHRKPIIARVGGIRNRFIGFSRAPRCSRGTFLARGNKPIKQQCARGAGATFRFPASKNLLWLLSPRRATLYAALARDVRYHMTTIRPMTAADITQCLACAHAGWGRDAASRAIDEFTAGVSTHVARPVYYVAEVDSLVVGVAGYAPSWIDWDTWSLCWVSVLPHQRNRGLGRALVHRCIEDLRLVARHVILTTNVPEFYHVWNFEAIREMSDKNTLMILDFVES